MRTGRVFICGPDAVGQSVVVAGKVVHFDFSRHGGPLVTNAEGEPLARQPISERHPFWPPFNAWLKAWNEAHPARPPKPGPTDHLDRSRAR